MTTGPAAGERSYPDWALAAYREQIAPVLHAVAGDTVDAAWLASCDPGGDEATRYRLFPGSLLLLWIGAFGRRPDGDALRIAAALECLHNASLHHDDVLDGHDTRRGVPTRPGGAGAPASLLAGDGLIGAALAHLGALTRADAPAFTARLGRAFGRMNHGQRLDEPPAWEAVAPDERWRHWQTVSRHKLALGNVAAPLAALWAGRVDVAPRVERMHEDFSLVSQALNDLGDREGWAGFHVIAACARERGHEAGRKPTLASIWGAELEREGLGGQASSERLHRRVLDEIRSRTAHALERLGALDLEPGPVAVLEDFFRRPAGAFEAAAGSRKG